MTKKEGVAMTKKEGVAIAGEVASSLRFLQMTSPRKATQTLGSCSLLLQGVLARALIIASQLFVIATASAAWQEAI